MSHKNKSVNSVSITPELVARLGNELEGGGMSANYIRALAVEATIRDTERGAEGTDTKNATNNGFSKEQSNVVPFMPRCSNRSDAKESASIAEVAFSLAIYQALGNSIDIFDWNTLADPKEPGFGYSRIYATGDRSVQSCCSTTS